MRTDREEKIRDNKLFFYSFFAFFYFGFICLFLVALSRVIDDSHYGSGSAILNWSFILSLIMIILWPILMLYPKPDFEPRTLRNLEIRNRSLNEIEKIITNWFSQKEFEILHKKEEKSIIITGVKKIDYQTMYIFEISVKEIENICNLNGEFYMQQYHNFPFRGTTESSLNNKKFGMGSIRIIPAWFLMEDLIQNLQNN